MALVARPPTRAGRGDLPDRGVHRPAPRRARRAALARRRLRRLAHPRPRELRGAAALTTPKSRQGPLGPDGARRSPRRSRGSASASVRPATTTSSSPAIVGGYLDALRAVAALQSARCERAGLRRLRFHDLRHTFGTRMIAKADIRRVQEWMGHADVQTTMKYLHYAPRPEDAALVAEAFELGPVSAPPTAGSSGSAQGSEDPWRLF